jgi:CPA1 family monovalent cation:H+ antiporter
VFFLTILGAIEKGIKNFAALDVVLLFCQEVFGGLLLGLIVGFLVFYAVKKIDHYQTEVLISLACVLLIGELAILTHVSGPLATVVAGLFVGNRVRKNVMSEQTRDYHSKFWELIDEFLNAFLFVLIGFQLVLISFSLSTVIISLICIFLLLISRYISIIIPIILIKNKKLYNRKSAFLLSWAGLRGGLSIAMALSIPVNPMKEIIVTATYTIVIFSILVQGLTTERLVTKLFPK